MKYRKIPAILLAGTLLCSMCGCGAGATKSADMRETEKITAASAEKSAEKNVPESHRELVLTDQMGHEVRLTKPAERIVVIEAADCEILYALGCGDRLVGRGEYCDYPEDVLDVPSVQSGYETNLEQILALAPDLVIMNTMNQSAEELNALENAGIAVVQSASKDIGGVYENIRVLGIVLGREAEAEALAEDMKKTFEEISSGAAVNEGKTVYFEVSPLEWGLWTAGTNTFMDEIAGMLGLTNIFEDVNGWGEVSEEQVLERCPDYIVTISMYYGEGPTPTEEILSRSGWENVPAVQNRAILNLQNNELSRPSYRLAEGAREMAEFIESCRNAE